MRILKYLFCGVLGGIVMVLPLYLHYGRWLLLVSVPAGVVLAVVLVMQSLKPRKQKQVQQVKMTKTITKSSVPAGIVTDPSVWDDVVPAEVAAPVAEVVADEPIVDAVVVKSTRASRNRVKYECQNAIEDAYKNYDRNLKKAEQEYTDALQPINAEFYAVLRRPNIRDNAVLVTARKKYQDAVMDAEESKQKSISSAGAVLDVELKHQHDLMEER